MLHLATPRLKLAGCLRLLPLALGRPQQPLVQLFRATPELFLERFAGRFGLRELAFALAQALAVGAQPFLESRSCAERACSTLVASASLAACASRAAPRMRTCS